MKIIKKEFMEKENIEKIICNCCGKEIPKDSHGYFEDYLHIEKTWGYTSEKDGENIDVDICQKCWENISSEFDIK